MPMESVYRAIGGMLTLTVQNVRNADAIKPVLLTLGERHSTYGAIPEFYTCFGEALITTVKETLEPNCDDELLWAWSTTYTKVANMMLEGQGFKDGIPLVNIHPVLESARNVDEQPEMKTVSRYVRRIDCAFKICGPS